jgi:hypothetical protein
MISESFEEEVKKYDVFIGLPVAWIETIEAKSQEEAEKIAERLIRDEGWLEGLDIKVNGENTNLVNEGDVWVEDVDEEELER